MSQLIIDSGYKFFNNDDIDIVNGFFSQFLNSSKMLNYINTVENKYRLHGQALSIHQKELDALLKLNDIEGLGIRFDVDENVNLAYGFLPDFKSMTKGPFTSKKFNETNKNKVYKVLIPKGVGEYVIADASIGYNKDKDLFFIKSLTPNKTSFLEPAARSRLRTNGKVNQLIYSNGADGLVHIANADYDEIVNRLYRYNVGVAMGTTSLDDGELLDIVANAATQTQSPNRIVNLMTAFQAQGSFGIKQNSYRNVNSTTGYISGTELADVLNTNAINKQYTYKMTFGLDDSNDILDIVALDKNGVEVPGFKGSDEYDLITGSDSSPFFKKDRMMTKIGYFNSRLSDAMVEYDENGKSLVSRYNARIAAEFKNNGQISRQKSYEIANDIVLDYQARTLDRYGFNTKFDNSDKSKYVESFFNYYENLPDEEQSGYLAEFYNRIKYNLDVGTIAGNIYEGRALDNLMTIGKQSKNTLDTKQYFSQAFLNPLFIENVQGQRKAQALDRLPVAVLNVDGEEYNVADITRDFFSGIKEMNFKKTQFEYLQRKAMIKKLGKTVGIDENNMPNVSNSMIRVLYAETDFAFQDSSIYTNSSAMQIPAMFDNKQDFSISYNSLKRNVYGDISNEQLENFFDELRTKKYNISNLSDKNKVISTTILQNLLGEDNYNKYVIGRKKDIIEELQSVGDPLKNITKIEGNEIEYIKASNEVTGKFNSWLNKFFIKSDATSSISIINPEMVDGSIATTISGSNYANFDNIRFTENGISFGVNRIFIQGHGSKVMNDHIKSTTQMLTNLLGAQFKDGSRMFFEGVINEKYTKAKRGFTGTHFARILTTAAYNAINADYERGDLTAADKFNLFKSYMSNTSLPTNDGINNKMRNIFEILNIDMRYENGRIVFDDKSVGKAIDAFNFSQYESIDAMIFDNLRKHRKEIFGRDLVNDEGRILGAYAQDLVAYAYSDLSKQMTEDSRNRLRLYEEDFDLLKDYVTGDEVGLSNLGRIKRGWFLLSNNAMMMETKKRKTEEGLKLGRLSALTLTELGMDNVVRYIKEEGISNKNVMQTADYIALSAPVGTEFARGAEAIGKVRSNYYEQAFTNQNKINIATDVDIYSSSAMNDNIHNFLTNSPIGKLMDYDIEEGRLRKNTQGIITGFSQEYIDSLKTFFSLENRKSVHKEFADFTGYSILKSNLHTYKQSFTNNEEFIKKLEKFEELITGDAGKKARTIAFLNTVADMLALDQKTYIKLQKEKGFFDIGKYFYNNYNQSLKKQLLAIGNVDKNLVNNFFDFSLKNNKTSKRSLNLFKTMASIATMYNQSLGEGSKSMFNGFNKLTKAKLEQNLYNFNLFKDDLFSVNVYLNQMFKDPDNNTGKILKGFFKNFDSIRDHNIYNILELQQISQFGNIPFLIDTLNADKNANIVPNEELSKYGKIIQTAKELEMLEKNRNDLKVLLGESLDTDSDEYKKALEKANKRRNDIFDNFLKTLKDPEQIADVKEEIENVNNIFKHGDMNLSNLSTNTFFNILAANHFANDKDKNNALSSFVSGEISEKLFKFKTAVGNNSYNSTVRKTLNNYGMIKSLDDIIITPDMSFDGIKLSDIQKQILEDSFFGTKKNRFSFDNFNKAVMVAKNNIKKINEADNYLEDVYSIENFIKGIIGTEFKNQVGTGAIEYEQYLKAIENGISYEDFIDLTSEITGAKATNKKFALLEPTREFVVNQQAKLSKDIEKEISQKQSLLTNLLMTRLNKMYERISAKGGALYEMSTIAEKASSAFSPREASAMTMFMKEEARDILIQQRRIMSKDKAFLDTDIGKEMLSKYKKTKNDFEKAMRLVYGEELINDPLKSFDEDIIKKVGTVGTDDWDKWLEDSTEALRKKLNNFSHVVLGTDEDWKNAGRFHLFENNGKLNKIYYGFLSRNPHQYKLSVSPIRMVRLNDADINLSFIGKYLGSGNKVKSTQSSLMMLGKLTALGAKGDFDGDIFQILSLGFRSLDINRMKGMTAKQFAREFDNKSQLFHLMNNMAGQDLRTAFYNDNLDNSQKSLKKLISQVYFDGKKVSSSEAYDAIEDVYLSLSHEKARILKTLTEEIEDHANVSHFKGFYDIGDNKVSKKSIGAFLLSVDHKARNRYLQGIYDSDNLLEMLKNNNKLTAVERKELIDAFNVDDGKSLLKTFEKIREDKEVPLFQTIYEYINNYLNYTGIAKTGEVHDKLTNYREVIDTLIDPTTMDLFRKNLNIKDTANMFNSQTLYRATMGHEIGDLIETLAISSKKGNTSPDLILQSFTSSEKIMRNNNLDFNLNIIADYNTRIEREVLSGTFDTINEIKNKTFYDFFSSLYLNSYEFVNTLDKNGAHTNQRTFSDLMRIFLTISTGENNETIEYILNNRNKITMDEIYKKIFKDNPRQFVSILSNWSQPMIVGNYERLANVDNLNRVDHNTIFGSAIKSSFKVATNLLDLIKIGDEGLGTRLNASIFRMMNKKFDALTKAKMERNRLKDVVESKLDEADNEKIREETTKIGKEYVDKVKEEATTEKVINKANNFNTQKSTQMSFDFGTESNQSINTTEKVINKANNSNINKANNSNTQKSTQMSFDFDNASTEDIKNISNKVETKRITEDIKDYIKDLKKEIEKLKKSNADKDKQIKDLENNIDTKQNRINDLQDKNKFYQKQEQINNSNASVIKKVIDRAKEIANPVVEKTKNVSNSDVVNAAKEKITTHKKGLAIAGGAITLASFFRIFQSNRPVVNLDINEQEYERSQGSLYRNLGQYTMNTNIRSLY